MMMLTMPKSRSPGLMPDDAARLRVGQRLREARYRAGLTLEDVGEALGVVRQSVSKWEAGETYPTGERLRRLATLYNVSLDWLLGQEEPKQLRESKAAYGAGEPPPTEVEARLMREFLRYLRQQRSSSGETQDTINRRNESPSENAAP